MHDLVVVASIVNSSKPAQDGRPARKEHYIYNAVGHSVLLMDGDCVPVQVNLFEAFGGIEQTWGNSDNNRLANTKERDASIALDNHGFRYYDASIGRYISNDPIGYEGGFNLYVHCTNDPVNKFDPLGLKEKDNKEEIEKLKKRLAKLSEDIRKLRNDIDSLRKRIDALHSNRDRQTNLRNSHNREAVDLVGNIKDNAVNCTCDSSSNSGKATAVNPEGNGDDNKASRLQDNVLDKGSSNDFDPSQGPKSRSREDREQWAKDTAINFKQYQIDVYGKEIVDSKSAAAQWAHETSWAKDSELVRKAHNLGGIKGKGSAGSINAKTHEVINGEREDTQANFRAYNDTKEFYRDYITVISKDRYQGAVSTNDSTGAKGREFFEALKRGGYATDPAYVDKATAIYTQIWGKEND